MHVATYIVLFLPISGNCFLYIQYHISISVSTVSSFLLISPSFSYFALHKTLHFTTRIRFHCNNPYRKFSKFFKKNEVNELLLSFLKYVFYVNFLPYTDTARIFFGRYWQPGSVHWYFPERFSAFSYHFFFKSKGHILDGLRASFKVIGSEFRLKG